MKAPRDRAGSVQSTAMPAGVIGQDATLVDLRDAVPFGEGHLTGSVHIKIRSPDFVARVLRFTPDRLPLVLIADSEDDADWAAAELNGKRDISGRIVGAANLARLRVPVSRLPALSPEELFDRVCAGTVRVLDVREPSEWQQGVIAGSVRIPMYDVLDRVEELPRDTPLAIVCAGGQRSSLIGSLLRARGFTELFNVTGGMKAWSSAGLPTSSAS